VLIAERIATTIDFVLAKAGIMAKKNSIIVLARKVRASSLDVVLTSWPTTIRQAGIKTKRPIFELCAAKYIRGISADENNIQLATRISTKRKLPEKLLLSRYPLRIAAAEIMDMDSERTSDKRKCRASR
jgi:hypothetical protein